jgi:hypothetical protein
MTRVNGVYDVTFDGRASGGGGFVFGNADVTLSYRGIYNNLVISSSLIPQGGAQWAAFQDTTNEQVTARRIEAIGIGIPAGTNRYSFSTVNPADVTNNTTVIAGRWYDSENTLGILYGTLSGTVTVVPSPFAAAPQSTATTTPISFAYTFDAVTTTALDENGLLTPKVAVRDGIEMNGSRINNLVAGIAPADAVNVQQMTAAVASEASARTNSDTALANAVDNEAATRRNADFGLSQRIDVREAVDNTLAANLASETASRLASDNALSGRLDAMSGRLDQIDSRLDRLDARIASSTAIAVAMSGNAFLPGTRFNLTSNVATYDGAQAGSIQLGVMVAANLAVNAAVASGFNKHGKTAARAGFTVGW